MRRRCPIKLIDASEIVFGLLLDKKLIPDQVVASHFAYPYDEATKLLKGGADIQDLYDKIGINAVQAALEAGKVVSQQTPLDFVNVLDKAFSREQMAGVLKAQLKRIERGEDIDYSALEREVERTLVLDHRYVLMNSIDPETNVWVKTGYLPIDENIGGLPSSNLTIIAAPPGCLVGDTMVGINRAGKSFQLSIKELNCRINGGRTGGRIWRDDIITQIRVRAEDGIIRLASIKSVMYSGDKPVYTLGLKSGRTLTGTIDHPILTDIGWVELGKLVKGNKVYVESTSQKKQGKKERNYYTILDEVISITPSGIQPTFDIEVINEPHNFLANGIVVHNTGKTSLALKIALSMAKQKKKVLFYTFEMTPGQLRMRTDMFMKAMSQAESTDVLNYIEVCADIMDMYEVSAEASRKVALDGVECIIIDFADLMLHTAEEESTVALLYRSMAKLAKNSGVPVLLLSQLNRQYTERGGVPRIHNIRWSGLAEAMAALIILIYNPNQIYGAPPSGKIDLVVPENCAALIVGKSRFGYKLGGVGAIILPWDGKLSWGDEALQWQSMTSV